ncbi:hypothetical protein [Lysinibacillus sp. JNUCC 51]|uniref:hypothetical protein n=1 Tax=Lysinibacillus sp. JNUCC-51 TaxID=2792479 RepID=UPI00193857A4|nr:hypothetical protein JNUCC51_15205 [Lysinibacillus sp. JNUCC-51]
MKNKAFVNKEGDELNHYLKSMKLLKILEVKQIIKQQKWWKRSLNTFLATALVVSSVSFVGTPQKAKAAPARHFSIFACSVSSYG